MGTYEIVHRRCFAAQKKYGKPPSMLGIPPDRFLALLTEMRAKGLESFIEVGTASDRTYAMVPLWDLKDGAGERAVECFEDNDAKW